MERLGTIGGLEAWHDTKTDQVVIGGLWAGDNGPKSNGGTHVAREDHRVYLGRRGLRPVLVYSNRFAYGPGKAWRPGMPTQPPLDGPLYFGQNRYSQDMILRDSPAFLAVPAKPWATLDGGWAWGAWAQFHSKGLAQVQDCIGTNLIAMWTQEVGWGKDPMPYDPTATGAPCEVCDGKGRAALPPYWISALCPGCKGTGRG